MNSASHRTESRVQLIAFWDIQAAPSSLSFVSPLQIFANPECHPYIVWIEKYYTSRIQCKTKREGITLQCY